MKQAESSIWAIYIDGTVETAVAHTTVILHPRIPWVLMQAAFAAHLSVPRTHSLMSMLHVGPSNLQVHTIL